MNEIIQYWSREILSVGLLLPIIYWFLRENKKSNDILLNNITRITEILQNHMLDDKEQLTKIFDILDLHRKEANEEFQNIAKNSLLTVLNKEQTIDLFKHSLWYVSQKKLDFIKSILLNNHLEGNKEKIRSKIESGLIAFSDEYLSKFATYKTAVGDLSKWTQENLTKEMFDKFVDDIMDIIYRKQEGPLLEVINNKINDISVLMKTMHVYLANKLRTDIK